MFSGGGDQPSETYVELISPRGNIHKQDVDSISTGGTHQNYECDFDEILAWLKLPPRAAENLREGRRLLTVRNLKL
jgi:hypothetical protein